MNIKSRSNYNINFCLKIKCLNRNIKCNECIHYSNFLEEKDKVVFIIQDAPFKMPFIKH